MHVILLAVGLAGVAAGAALIGTNLPLDQVATGRMLVIAGTVAVAAGVILARLASTNRQLAEVARALDLRPAGAAVPAGAEIPPLREPPQLAAATPPLPTAAAEAADARPEPTPPVLEPLPPVLEPPVKPALFGAPNKPRSLASILAAAAPPPESAPRPDTFTPPDTEALRAEIPHAEATHDEPRLGEPQHMEPPRPHVEPQHAEPPHVESPTRRPMPSAFDLKADFDALWFSPPRDLTPDVHPHPPPDVPPAPYVPPVPTEHHSDPEPEPEPAHHAADPVTANAHADAHVHEPELPPWRDEAPHHENATVFKSGVIDGMAYALFTDGSIEAELPDGKVRFATVDELRDYLDQAGSPT